MAVKAAELLIEFTGSTVSLERASNRTNELILKNQTAIIRFQKTLEGLDRKTPDFGSRGARAAAGSYRDLNNELSSLSSTYARFGGSGATAGIGALALGFTAAARAGIEYKGMLDRTTRSFEGMLGSQQAALAHMKEMQEFANRTPFEFEDVARASQRFVAMGMSAKDTIPYLTAIGNAVAKVGGGKEQIDSVSLAIAQVSARGKVSAQEMNQLANALVDGWKPLEAELGKTRGELFKMAEQGEISAETFLRAFRRAHEGGSAMKTQMETLSGASSTLRDYINQLNAGGFTPLYGILRDVTVELAKMSTEGWNAERALSAAASAAKNAFEAVNPGAASYGAEMLGLMLGGMPGMEAVARARAAQAGAAQNAQKFGEGKQRSWFDQPVNIPQALQYKPTISDADLLANMKRQDEQAREEAQRKAEEAARKARAEAEKQANAVQGLAERLRDLTIQNRTFNESESEQQIALMRARAGVEALSGSYRQQADVILNLTAVQMRALDVRQKLKEEEDRQKQEAGKVADARLRVEQTFVDLLQLQGAELRRVNDLLTDPHVRDALTVQEAKMLAVLASMKDIRATLQSVPLEPGTAKSNLTGGAPPLDLSNVKEDYWATLRESWRENLSYMREDGQHILGQFFLDLQGGFKSATFGMLSSFTQMLAQMAAQSAASQIFSTLLSIAGAAFGGMFAGSNLPAANAGGGIWSGLPVPKFATGGSFIVGGPGGTDTTPVAFMATKGERVTVETPGQQRMGGGVNINFHVTAPAGSIPRETQAQLARKTVRALEAARGGAF